MKLSKITQKMFLNNCYCWTMCVPKLHLSHNKRGKQVKNKIQSPQTTW